ncbi:MAG: hypothetical protein KAR85_04545 [Methanosarcinales archaeon]|nr:hypothetical protein [Methanosarcinales archaeon]
MIKINTAAMINTTAIIIWAAGNISSTETSLKSLIDNALKMNGTILAISARDPDSSSIENLNPGNMKKLKRLKRKGR